MEEDQIANFVLAYLKKKGFKEAEQAFLEELRLDKTNSSSSFSIDLDSAKQLLAVPENKMCDRNGKWEESSEGESNYEMHDLDSNDEDECYYAPELAPKLQFRKYVSTVCWNEKMEMAEVLENKGRLWTTTGIVRCGKIYCSVEETLFLMEIGAIMLLNDGKGCISLKDLYGKVAGGKNGCTWEQFEVYKHLKSLGYIVGRHGVPWSVKKVKNCGDSVPSQSSGDKNEILVEESKNMDSINLMFNEMQIGGTRPMFDVYPPNSKFRKSSPGDPSFIICFAREHPPCKEEIEELERQCGRVPLKFSVVEHGRVSIFAFEEVSLPLLP